MIKPNSQGLKRALAAHSIHECAGARCPLFNFKCESSCHDKLAGFVLEYIKELETYDGFFIEDVLSEERDPDAHSCYAEADEWGYCQVCGAVVHGSLAYYEETGSDPPDSY